MKNFLLLVLLLSFGAVAGEPAITFKSHGKAVSQISLKEMAQKFEVQTVTVEDPHEERKIAFKAYSAKQVLDKIYGKDWEKSEEILFTAADGYQPSVPIDLFKKTKAYFAIQREDSRDFIIVDKTENNKRVEVGPLFLIWSGDVPAAFWPYQVVTVDLTTFEERFPHLTPPTSASAAAKRGFFNFRTYCMQCHTMNGEGGNSAPDLNYPVNVTEYYKDGFLKKWIDNPNSIRLNTKMPPMDKAVKDRKNAIDDVIAYLKAMKRKQVAPEKKPQN